MSESSSLSGSSLSGGAGDQDAATRSDVGAGSVAQKVAAAAEAVPEIAASLFVASTDAAGIDVADISTGMSTRPPPPITASIQPANAAAPASSVSVPGSIGRRLL